MKETKEKIKSGGKTSEKQIEILVRGVEKIWELQHDGAHIADPTEKRLKKLGRDVHLREEFLEERRKIYRKDFNQDVAKVLQKLRDKKSVKKEQKRKGLRLFQFESNNKKVKRS